MNFMVDFKNFLTKRTLCRIQKLVNKNRWFRVEGNFESILLIGNSFCLTVRRSILLLFGT